MNRLLSICIPTYNRAEIIKKALQHLIPQVERYSIPIYVSDNASTDNTSEVVKSLNLRYPFIFYSCNRENLGMDRNFEAALKMSRSRYAWLLGDDDWIQDGAVERVLDMANGNYDLIVLNGGNPPRVRDIPDKEYTDKNELMVDVGWHMTWLSCLVVGSGIINGGRFEKYYGTSIVHIATVFDYLSDKDIHVLWSAEPMLAGDTKERCWTKSTFEIFAKNWFEVIYHLPQGYSMEAKLACIKNHGTKGKFFSMKSLAVFRSQQILNFAVYKKYNYLFKYVTNVPKCLIFLLCALPASLFGVLWDMIRFVKSCAKALSGTPLQER